VRVHQQVADLAPHSTGSIVIKGCIWQRLNVVRVSILMMVLLVTASWIFLFTLEGASLSGYFSAKNLYHAKELLGNMLGLGAETPAFLDMTSWHKALALTYETMQMSVLAIGFAGIGMLITVLPAARTVADGSLTLTSTWYGWLVFGTVRFLYILSRAVPELVWAMIIVFMFKPGILPGAIALGLHNFGILGKLCAEVVEDLDWRPVRSLRSSGASWWQMLFYGVLPTVTPKFLTYLLYRWEVIIRTTIIVGFVGAGGLGQQFKLSMSWLHYTEITLLLICYFLLVVLADATSGLLRRFVQ